MNEANNVIIHHMSDGSVRNSVEGVFIPIQFKEIYELAYTKRNKGEKQDGNCNKSGNFKEE